MSEDINFGKTKIEIPKFDFKKIRKTIFGVLVIIIATGSFYTVGANENGVVVRFGKYSHTTMPGLQFKIPLVDKGKRKDHKVDILTVDDDIVIATNSKGKSFKEVSQIIKKEWAANKWIFNNSSIR